MAIVTQSMHMSRFLAGCSAIANAGLSYSFDLWSVVRYTGVDETSRKAIWDDGVHLTEAGYHIMGKAVAARLFELLQQRHRDNVPGQAQAK